MVNRYMQEPFIIIIKALQGYIVLVCCMQCKIGLKHRKAHSRPNCYTVDPILLLLFKAELRNDTALFYALLKGWKFTAVNSSLLIYFLALLSENINTPALLVALSFLRSPCTCCPI